MICQNKLLETLLEQMIEAGNMQNEFESIVNSLLVIFDDRPL